MYKSLCIKVYIHMILLTSVVPCPENNYIQLLFFTQKDNDDDKDVKNIKEGEKEKNEEEELEKDGKSQPMNLYHAPGIIFN